MHFFYSIDMNKQHPAYSALFGLTLLFVTLSNSAKAEQVHLDRSTDTLAPILTCIAQGNLQLAKTNRLPAHIQFRQVMTTEGNRKVSTLDGYKLILETAPNVMFVDLKLEQSDAKLFSEDRVAIIAQMQKVYQSKMTPAKPIPFKKLHDIEIIALDQLSLDVNGPLSMYTLLSESRAVIATAYMMNQPAELRAFKTMREYEVLRDQFIDDLVGCLKADQTVTATTQE